MKNKFSEKRLARESLDFTEKIIREFGPRPAGSESAQRAAGKLHAELERSCDRAYLEEFDMRPGSFLGFLEVSSTLYIAATILLLFHYIIPATIGYTLATSLAFSQFICYRQVFDFLFRKKKGFNAYGVIEPKGEVRGQVVISGHHDSAYEFTLMKWLRRGYRPCVAGILVSLNAAPLFAWIWIAYQCITGTRPWFAGIYTWAMLASLIFIIPMHFFRSKKGTPGAGDNLIASAMAVKLAEFFGAGKTAGKSSLRHTRLIFLSVDAEEAGLRGARAFAKRHSGELLSIPTRVLNFDSIYRQDRIQFLISDINGFVKLSRGMAEECVEIAGKAGYPAKLFRVYPGVGGTDAAEFAKIGVEATTLIAFQTNVEKEPTVYHTRDDVVDAIEPGAVEACLRIAYEYIMKKDFEAGLIQQCSV